MSSLALHDRARVRWAAVDLDRRLAEGADPGADPLLGLRAERLVTPAVRGCVAAGLERAVGSVRRAQSPLTAAVPLRWGQVRGARRELLTLAEDLRGKRSVRARGVAMAERLITDPCSPLYTAATSDEVADAARAAGKEL